jgi:hypothetical protein
MIYGDSLVSMSVSQLSKRKGEENEKGEGYLRV